jgi:hypothetical protein
MLRTQAVGMSNYKVLLLVKVKNLIKTRVRRLLFFNLNKKRIKKKIFNIEKNWQQFSPRRGVVPQNDICPHGNTYPKNAVAITASKIITPTLQVSRGCKDVRE